MSRSIISNSGGVAVHSGIGYQNRVAAWLCVRILAEQEATPLWDWSADTTIEYLRCEIDQPIDDIWLGTSQQGLAYINVKRPITASRAENSEFASVLSQFARQFIASQNQIQSTHLGKRTLDEKLDRFVLITKSATAPIKDHLPDVLDRIRSPINRHRIDDAANTQAERDILSKVKSHLQRSWLQITGNPATEQELIDLLRLVRIEVLDVDANRTHEREAKDRLRASVLQNTEQADAAWDILVQTCADWASRRDGGTRETLQEHLLQAGIALKAPRSFRKDIERLREYSELTFKLLRPLSVIEIDGKEIKIQRPASQALREAAENNSLVVVGEPGAGKSGVLHDLVERLRQENRDVVFLAVDKLEAQSLGGLQRELLLEHDICKVLQNWPGTTPGFLVIDALDAARSPTTAQTFYDLLVLMLSESTRWRVITSIRQYDLRHNTKLRPLFSGQPPSQFRSAEFLSLCHLNVPRLSVEEWLQIAAQSLELSKLFIAADEKLRELLFVPFNVKLMAELIGRGIAIERLTPLRTQIELLDLYWTERVAQPLEDKDAREILLERAVKEMVRTRSLRVSRRQVATATADSTVLKNILSAHILSGQPSASGEMVNDDILTFAHHVLFDYVVARLLLRSSTPPLVKFLEDDPEQIIAIRPSLVIHFEYERWQDLKRFWEIIFSINHSQIIPEIGKLIGPSVAVEAATAIEDFSPLIQALAATDLVKRECAEKAFRHVAGALMVKGIGNATLVGPSALNWSELLNQATAEPSAATIYSSYSILDMICAQPELLTEDQRQAAGIVARRILEFALSQSIRNPGLVIGGIQAVCRTYESDKESSGKLLRRCLEPEHVLQHGHEELFRLGNEIERLIPLDPQLVEEIYRAAFTLIDYSEDSTPMGSQILQMVSTRRQDFELARHALAEEYNKFVNQAPINALGALIASLKIYQTEPHNYWGIIPSQEEDFDFNGQQARIKPDRSEMWARSRAYGNHEEPLKMLHVFEDYLDQISDDEKQVEQRKRLIDLLIAENNTAVLWRILLEVATKHPKTLGLEICPLAWALPILTCDDTSRPVRNYLKAAFQYFTVEGRKQVEQAILLIPETVSEELREYAEHKRNHLLRCLDTEAIVMERTRACLVMLNETNIIPTSEDEFYTTDFTYRQFTDEDELTKDNVPIGEGASSQLLPLLESAKSFAGTFSDAHPSLTEFQEIIPRLQLLHAALLMPEVDECPGRTRDLAWGCLAEACKTVAKSQDFNGELSCAGFIKTTLLEAAKYPVPQATTDQDGEEQLGWESHNAARVDAAEGIMHLANKTSGINEELVEAIERLANDPSPPVRFMIATSLNALYHTAPELMWQLLENFSQEEGNKSVLQFLVARPLNSLAARHADRVAMLARSIFDRVCGDEKASETRQSCAHIFVGLYIWQDQPPCQEIIEMIANTPAEYSIEAHKIAYYLRFQLNLGPIEPPDIMKDQVRLKSFDLLCQLLSSILSQTRSIESKYSHKPSFALWDEADQRRWRALAHLADSIGRQLYFASGAYRDSDSEPKIIRGVPERTRFWKEAHPSLELLAEFGYPSLVHHLMKTLVYLLQFDPVKVFLLIGKVVEKGKPHGYQYESLAVDLIVGVVERFIAEYRHHLQENEDCRRTFIEILDTFIEAGWPAARRLTYRLEEIYR